MVNAEVEGGSRGEIVGRGDVMRDVRGFIERAYGSVHGTWEGMEWRSIHSAQPFKRVVLCRRFNTSCSVDVHVSLTAIANLGKMERKKYSKTLNNSSHYNTPTPSKPATSTTHPYTPQQSSPSEDAAFLSPLPSPLLSPLLACAAASLAEANIARPAVTVRVA